MRRCVNRIQLVLAKLWSPLPNAGFGSHCIFLSDCLKDCCCHQVILLLFGFASAAKRTIPLPAVKRNWFFVFFFVFFGGSIDLCFDPVELK